MSEEEIPPPPRELSPDPAMRASDEDRERLVADLNEHTVAGRLNTEDLEQRVQAAYAAQTKGELAALRRDLPVSSRQAALDHAARRALLSRRLIQETAPSLGAFVICSGVWLVAGATGQFWPVWVLIVVAMTLVRSAWALYGPAPDLDAVESHLDSRREQRLTRHQRRGDRRGRR
jgi:hypothetical protein